MRINHLLPELIIQQLWGLSYFYRPRKPVAKDVLGYLRGRCCCRNELQVVRAAEPLPSRLNPKCLTWNRRAFALPALGSSERPRGLRWGSRCPREGQSPGTLWKDLEWEGAEYQVHMCVPVSGFLLPKQGYEKS